MATVRNFKLPPEKNMQAGYVPKFCPKNEKLIIIIWPKKNNLLTYLQLKQ
jgi:hypothetical protein